MGISFSNSLSMLFGTGGFGLAVDGHGDMTYYYNAALGGGTPGFMIGRTLQWSNADSIRDLEGPFITASVGWGQGANVTFDQFGGKGSQNQPIYGVGATLGFGFGSSSGVTYGPTYLGPVWNPFK